MAATHSPVSFSVFSLIPRVCWSGPIPDRFELLLKRPLSFKVHHYWFLYLPLLILAAETLAQPLTPLFQSLLNYAWKEQPLVFSVSLARVIFRAWLAYACIALLVDLSFALLASKKAWAESAFFRAAGFLFFYSGLAVASALKKLPPDPKKVMILAILALVSGGILFFWGQRRLTRGQDVSPRGLSSALRWVSVVLAIFLLSIPNQWEGTQPPMSRNLTAAKDERRPSFLLVALDGVPGDFLSSEEEKNHPFGQKSALQFSNAYAPTNSAYPSWYSLLSGRYPFRSGVETLFPKNRLGNLGPGRLLPELLKGVGYRTVYMTDCASMSFFGPESGFSERFQADRGVFGCLRSFQASRHLITLGAGRKRFFPETDADCSQSYRPKAFFERVQAKLSELEDSPEPYFLAVHSCAANPQFGAQLAKRVTDEASMASILETTGKISALMDESPRAHPRWTFVTAAHGRMVQSVMTRHLSIRALTAPLNRFQFNVPLYVFGPSIARSENREELVSLLDIYPTVLKLAAVKGTPGDGGDLLEVRPRKSMILTSAFPTDDGVTLPRMLRKASIDRWGVATFMPEVERRLTERPPVAVVSLPYRIVFQSAEKVSIFEEREDPHNEWPLSQASLKPVIAEGLTELCRLYPRMPCAE